MLKIDYSLKPEDLIPKLRKFWELSGKKILLIEKEYDSEEGSPVFTINGKYTSRGWTDWTQGFEFGSAILQFDATDDHRFLELGRGKIVKNMAGHVSHTGVHDHGFNNVSTYGNLLRLIREGKIPFNPWEASFYELALKISGAIQASRWTGIQEGGFIYSFNGPHSLFIDTIRSCRILALSHSLGHYLLGEQDEPVSLLGRLLDHLRTTAKYSVYYGNGRDIYDIPGRIAHECIFNIISGDFRCPNTQQGYSPFSTWTRGLSWAILGFTEELEYLTELPDDELNLFGGRKEIESVLLKAAKVVAEFYIEHTPVDGIPYWDTRAPDLNKIGDYLNHPANPFNEFEPVDSSAAAIAAQGLLRLGHCLADSKNDMAERYRQAGITVLNTLLDEPYLSTGPQHHGLLLHTVYHRPNNWDHTPDGSRIPNGESGMWGDYHLREVALYLQKMLNKEQYYAFYNCLL
ncbi:MAG: glycosyl hydrolase [Bacteroides sp. SM23_62_1]|nr:MAG: glycosyl hydrolase [Bacteroides sp. SM23_62_1]